MISSNISLPGQSSSCSKVLRGLSGKSIISVRGSIEASSIEVNGHVEGKISADVVIVGKNAVIKGDIFFKNTLKTEEGADIDGYIKRLSKGKSETEEDIAIEEIVEREDSKKPRIVHVASHKEAV